MPTKRIIAAMRDCMTTDLQESNGASRNKGKRKILIRKKRKRKFTRLREIIQSLIPTIFTFTTSTSIPVKASTLYLIASFKDSATALMETPYFI